MRRKEKLLNKKRKLEEEKKKQEADYKARRDVEHGDAVRQTRNQRLTISDWTQLEDSPVDKAAWATYRQALRDVPEQEGFPWNVQWPEQP